MPMRIKNRGFGKSPIEQMEMTNKVRPNTVSESIYKMSHLIICHGEPKRTGIELHHIEPFANPIEETLEGHTH